ncbi:hypothetical protein CLI75_12345, partial [Porphyromonas gingivalis]
IFTHSQPIADGSRRLGFGLIWRIGKSAQYDLSTQIDSQWIVRTRFIRLDATAASGDKAVITMQEIGVTVE